MARTPRNDDQYDPSQEVRDDAIIGVAFRWTIVVLLIIGVPIALYVALAGDDEPEEVVIEKDPGNISDLLGVDEGTTTPDIPFTNITEAAGISFVHESGARGDKMLPETMGAGAAFFDYDNDGDADLLLINGTSWPWDDETDRSTMAMYANDGSGNFTDVTTGVGLDVEFYGTGCATGDYDGDGDIDLFVAAVGSNFLFRNDGGTFTDVTESAGLGGADDQWSTSSGFFDYDNDGDLDLFVCNYVRWSRDIDFSLNFTLNGVDRAYGPPTNYTGTHPYLYRNNGDGSFEDVSAASGVEVKNRATGVPVAKALALAFLDLDRDGWQDIVVANDTVQNFVFHNQQDGTFAEVGTRTGIAYDSEGRATGAMGIDVGHMLNDESLAIGIGNFSKEATSFYVSSRDPMSFADMTESEGIGSPSRQRLTFGLVFVDADLDGALDLIQANGHLEDEINEIEPSQHYEQPAQLFWNCGPDATTCFTALEDGALGDLAAPMVGRGVSFADIDADGDLDLLVTQVGRAPCLLRNDQATNHNWIRIRLRGTGGNRDAIGAMVAIAKGDATMRRSVMPTRSYLSQVEFPVTFGLGRDSAPVTIEVTWPDGSTSTHTDLAPNQLHILDQPPVS